MRRLPDEWFPRLWFTWMACTATGFVVLESHALCVGERSGRDTLTRNLKWLTRTKPRKVVGGSLWLVFAAWLFHHVIWDGAQSGRV